ncbi:glycosyltransferase family 2 protein [Psychromonas sp. RZ22]|uniref:glycosyltransferase family 2 protein n=1 Tax=Psychromonas algarum TaxID=2555643 RepID=UPI0010683D14|nr:glycosyltransferase family 2 protein [Psychromonas sp. RZ22]TEW56160.1 glycosyltransferase family 2 protein [Psychromonas sp. RZ22]
MQNNHNHIDVSIIIAAWNSASFIKKAIDSALQQVGVNVEVIVVDDCSTDDTCVVVKSYSDLRVRLICSEYNGGPGAARNIGFNAAQGEWIAVLDSDDTYQPFRLSQMLAASKDNVDVLIDNFYGQIEGEHTLIPYFHRNELPVGVFTLQFLIQSNMIYTKQKSTGYIKPIFRRSFIFYHNIKYWPEIKIGEDYYFLACCLAQGAKAIVVDVCAYVYTIRSGSISEIMTISHFERLLSSDEKFLKKHTLTKEEKTAQQLRTKNLLRGKNFLYLVERLKKKKLFPALKIALLSPSSVALLWFPIRKRLFGY